MGREAIEPLTPGLQEHSSSLGRSRSACSQASFGVFIRLGLRLVSVGCVAPALLPDRAHAPPADRSC